MTDRLIRATAADGGIRCVGAITTNLVEEARSRQSLSFVATAALGRAMTAGLLLVSSMKRAESRVNIRLDGDGPLGVVLADARLDGSVRGYVTNPMVELPPSANGKLDVGAAIGRNGFVYVIRDVGYGYPYSSTTQLVSGEVGDDITHYLATSEQTPSALLLGVFVEPEGVTSAGGLLLQIMPKAAQDESLVELLESRVASLSGFTPLLRAGKTLPVIFEELLGDLGLKILPEVQMLRFYCPCSRDRMLGALKLLGREELLDMIETDGGAEATCEFCRAVYHADVDDLHQIVAELTAESRRG